MTTPRHYDLLAFMGTIFDQGSIGTCFENALSAALTIQMNEASHWEAPISRLQVYYDDISVFNPITDRGSIPSLVFGNAKTKGLASESNWGYHVDMWSAQPSPPVYQDALLHKIESFSTLGALQAEALINIKTALNAGKPVLMEFKVYNWYDQLHGSLASQIVSLSDYGGTYRALHEATIVGYDDALNGGRGAFISQGSWGTGHGDNGLAIIPYDFVMRKDEVVELDTINSYCGVDSQFTPIRREISALYDCVLNRAADHDGLIYWSQQIAAGKSVNTVANDIINASGNQSVFYGATTNVQIATIMHQQVTGHAPDYAAQYTLTALLNNGMSKGELLGMLMNSVDNYSGQDSVKIHEAQLYDNKTDMSEYYAMALQQNNIPHASAALGTITYEAATLDQAKVNLIGQMIADHTLFF